MNELDLFVEKNYNKVKKHFYKEALEMGYQKDEREGYFQDCRCFIFVGTINELKETEKDYFIIAQKDNMVIAETFSGINYTLF